MTQHWLLRIGDGEHFKSSSPKNLWGINSKHSWCRIFLASVKVGDLLWFVKSGNHGQVIAVATYVERRERIIGPLLALTSTNEELGWTKSHGEWDTEVHYKDLYNITDCNLLSGIKSPLVIRPYNSEKCDLNLPEEYERIQRYSKVTRKM